MQFAGHNSQLTIFAGFTESLTLYIRSRWGHGITMDTRTHNRRQRRRGKYWKMGLGPQ